MSAVGSKLRAETRQRWRAWAGLALLVAVASGAAMTAAAGARRASSSAERFAEEQLAYDALLLPDYGSNCATRLTPGSLGAIVQQANGACLDLATKVEGVLDTARVAPFFGVATTDDGKVIELDPEVPTAPVVLAAADDALGTVLAVPKVLEGRLPARRSIDEAYVGRDLARRYGLAVGTRLRVELRRFEAQTDDGSLPGDEADLRIVGITATPGEIDASGNLYYAAIHTTSAFFEAYAPTNAAGVASFATLEDGLTASELQARLQQAELPVSVNLETPAIQADAIDRATGVESVALWLVAGVVTVAGLAFCGQALARQAAQDAADSSVLGALGMTPRELRRLVLARGAAIAGSGVVAGCVLAYVASDAMPIGLSEMIEPNPGRHLDVPVFAGGAAMALLACAFVVLPTARRVGHTAFAPAADVVAPRKPRSFAAGLSPVLSQGIRMAFDPGRGGRAVPVRSGLAGITVGTAVLVAAIVFSASIDRLLATPALAGWNWDAIVYPNLGGDEGGGGGITSAEFRAALLADPSVVGVAAAGLTGGHSLDAVSIAGVPLPLLGVEPLQGDVALSVISGRMASGLDEIALGSETMSDVGASIGDRVDLERTVAVSDGGDSFVRAEVVSRSLLVVGRVALPTLADSGATGRGGAVTLDALAELMTPDEQKEGIADDTSLTSAYLVRFRSDVDPDATLARLRRVAGDEDAWRRWARLEQLEPDRVRRLPAAVAAIVAALGLGTVAHVLVTTARRRRRELALLKTLGFVRPQLRRTMWAQASALVGVALLVGIPLGVVLGRSGWDLYARQLGVVPSVDVPFPVVPLVVAGVALVVANLVASVPATLAARVPAGEALRAE